MRIGLEKHCKQIILIPFTYSLWGGEDKQKDMKTINYELAKKLYNVGVVIERISVLLKGQYYGRKRQKTNSNIQGNKGVYDF